jgi:competence protein ComEC
MDREIRTNSVFVSIFGFLLGVLASSFVSISLFVSILITFIAVFILTVEKVFKNHIGKEVLFLCLFLLAFGLGALRFAIKDFHKPIIPGSTGVVIGEPEQKENSTRFIFRADNGEKVLVSTDLYSPVQYGDRIEISGKLQEPGIIDDGIGRPFDYSKYLAKDDIYLTMSFAEVQIVSSEHGNFIKHGLFRLKNSLINKMREILAEPESGLLAGLIVAGKGAMPKDILEEFRRAGVIHIVVLSGYNLTIIADFLRTVFGSAKLSILGVLFFVIMTGALATVVRAAIMVLAVVLAKMLHRNFSAPRALLAAAFLMILHNPKILVFDPSFQLSFLATCGLIYVAPIFEKFLSRVTARWGIRSMLATTLATQITVLPFLIYSVGDVSLVSLPANILILLFIPITMLVGFLATIVAYLSPIIAWPLSYTAHLLLSWILGVSHYLGNLSFASVLVPIFPFWVTLIIYFFIFISVKRLRSSPQHSSSLN